MPQQYVVTSALPYANGDVHLGHMVEHIQTDIFVRSLRLHGDRVLHICADDTHGTPIQIKAEQAGLTPEAFVAGWHEKHTADFKDFDIGFDFYGSTHCPENEAVATEIFNKLKAAGHIATRDVEQMYCESCKRFLPDRYIRGICPKCGTPDQYGDVCESCSTTYSPAELKEPRCALCRQPPVIRSSRHYFVTLGAYADRLREWTAGDRLQSDVRHYVDRWLAEGLRDWDISRDGPYFGFKIPGEENKYFYVWLDAPIGYISNTWRWCKQNNQALDSYWRNPDTRIIHFIGKDIIYFHTLFWPAMLMGSGFSLPHKVHVHGMLTANGEKLSKSRGTFINARTYLKHVDPQALRFYLAAKLTSGVEDIDLSFEDFGNRVNADLANRIVNLLSRSVQFANKRLASKLGRIPDDAWPLRDEIMARVPHVIESWLTLDYNRAIKLINECADIANKYLQDEKPFSVVNTDEQRARDVITFGVNAAKVVMALLKPVLPKMTAAVEQMLKIEPMTFESAKFDLEQAEIGAYTRLFERIDPKQLEALVEDTKQEAAVAAGPATPKLSQPIAPNVNYDQFMTVDLRAGRVVKAEVVEKADKLLRLEVDVGEGKPRQIFAGLRKTYAPEALVGKMVGVVANLEPRKMRFGMSEGMVLASGEDETKLHVVEVPDAAPGERIR